MTIAFYAPLKSPDHPVPSGDRQMARLLMAALSQAGYDPQPASTLRSYLPEGDCGLEALQSAAGAEVERLLHAYRSGAAPAPELWFTYHPYYKSPDLIGPQIADALKVPYVTAEATHANKRANGPWAQAHALNQRALERADLNFYFTHRDKEGLVSLIGSENKVCHLPPFLDVGAIPERTDWASTADGPVRLLTVAMMRQDVKLESYQMLAEALCGLDHLSWSLDIVGDGEARPQVDQAFASLPPERLTWHGRVTSDELAPLYGACELYVWPGFGEAYGMAFLEAQTAGLAVVAQETGGISSVVRHGETGLLTPLGDVEAFRKNLSELMENRARLSDFGQAALTFVRSERSIETASERLKNALDQLT
ncbi:MAG: glycosyltransferase family 4 protein [Pseudomonadota bacterium]